MRKSVVETADFLVFRKHLWVRKNGSEGKNQRVRQKEISRSLGEKGSLVQFNTEPGVNYRGAEKIERTLKLEDKSLQKTL